MNTHHLRGLLMCLAVTFAVLALYVVGGLETLELKTLDMRFALRGDRPASADIAVVNVDEASIEALGRWPWPRAVHGRLVGALDAAGARAIVFDILFTERDIQNPASDAAFVSAVRASGRVVNGFFFRQNITEGIFGRDPLFPFDPLPAESYTGFVNVMPDRDGVTRRAHLYAIEGDAVTPALPVAAYALAAGKTFQDVVDDLPIVLSANPETAKNEMLINYAYSRYADVYPVYSFVDVLAGRAPPDAFENKVVFIGGTAAALFDVKAVPFTSLYPGVLIHANILDNLWQRNYLRPVPGYWTAFLVLLLGIGLGFALPRVSPWVKLGVFGAVMVAGGVIAMWLFARHNVVVEVMPALLVSVGAYGGVLFYRLLIEEREKRRIRGSFRQYLSPKVIDVITKDPGQLKLGGEEKEVTIFFLDIAGFTTMAETLKPTQLVEIMNVCLTRFSTVILKRDGLINKYIGDCIMAFWNAPADQPGHAGLACLAALECMESLPDLNRQFQEKGLPAIDCRIGVNTGLAVVGNMGSTERFDYTVMGDPVNLASRLEGANKQYHSRVMISQETFEQAKHDIEARDLDLIRVKGKREPRKVFELLARRGKLSPALEAGREKYHQALALYRQQNFSEAIHVFQEVFDYLPNDHVTRVYLERARVFSVSPPPAGWDGVFEMKSK